MTNLPFKFKSMGLQNILLCFIFLPLSCFTEEIVTFKGGSVSSQEVAEKSEGDLFKIYEREYQIKTQAAREIAVEKILDIEAKKNKRNKTALVESYVEKNFQPPTESELLKIYERSRNTPDMKDKSFADVREKIYEYAARRSKENLKNQYKRKLSKDYKLRVNIKAPQAPKIDIDIKQEPFWGNPKAKVVVVEYSDFECPYCQRMQADAQRIRKEYQDKIKWVFKDFPLNFHRKARKAHIAANCAYQQNKFFDYQEKIFVSGTSLAERSLLTVGSEIGLNQNQFKKCLADKDNQISKEIDSDIKDGSRNGVRGTPTLFVNGKISSEFRSYAGMKKVLDRELEQLEAN